MNLDSEQKRVLKAALPAFGGYWIGYPILMWLFGNRSYYHSVYDRLLRPWLKDSKKEINLMCFGLIALA